LSTTKRFPLIDIAAILIRVFGILLGAALVIDYFTGILTEQPVAPWERNSVLLFSRLLLGIAILLPLAHIRSERWFQIVFGISLFVNVAYLSCLAVIRPVHGWWMDMFVYCFISAALGAHMWAVYWLHRRMMFESADRQR